MSVESPGYGYFGSVEDLLNAVKKRSGDKSGCATVFDGCKIVRSKESEKLEGVPERIYRVRVFHTGTLDIRSEDSYDNE